MNAEGFHPPVILNEAEALRSAVEGPLTFSAGGGGAERILPDRLRPQIVRDPSTPFRPAFAHTELRSG